MASSTSCWARVLFAGAAATNDPPIRTSAVIAMIVDGFFMAFFLLGVVAFEFR
jgi:hypothetical protein